MSFQKFDGLVLASDDINDLYIQAIDAVLVNGCQSSPRGLKTSEILHSVLQLHNPRKRVVTLRSRNINAAFAIAEWLWIMIGTQDGTIPLHYNRKLSFLVTEPPTKFEYSYGSRLKNWLAVDQLEAAYSTLRYDPDSRRAICTIFDPSTDDFTKANVPCVSLIQFTLRQNALDLTVYMRSNDLILGFVYDVFTFTLVQEIMAGWLGSDVGTYTHIAESLHIYERDILFAKDIISNQEGCDLYKNCEIPDLRLDKQTFHAAMEHFTNIEQLSRIGSLDNISDAEKLVDLLPTGWKGVIYPLLAYNVYRDMRVSKHIRETYFTKYLKLTDDAIAYLLPNRCGKRYSKQT